MIGYSQTCNTCSIRSSSSSIISIKGELKIGMGQLSSIKVKNRLLNIYGPAKQSSYGYAIIYCCFLVNGMGWRKKFDLQKEI